MNSPAQVIAAIFSGISAMAFFPILEIFFPKFIQELREIEETSLKRAFWIGVVNTIFFAALALFFNFLAENSGIQLLLILSLLLGIIFIAGTIFGLAATIQIISKKLLPESSPFKKYAFGSGITVLACFFPFVGWFGLLPFLIFVSFGGFMIRTLQRNKKEKEEKDK